MKNYGLLIKEPEPEAFVLGGVVSLDKVICQEDGQWDAFLPDYEPQRKGDIETYNCTSFGTLNLLEILFRKLYDNAYNNSDRFLGIQAETKPPGNDPHVVMESLRRYGTIEETILPFSNEITSWNDYYSYIGSDEVTCIKEAKKWLNKWVFGHEYVWKGNVSKEERTTRMKESLQYSPLGVSVTAWIQQDGVYIDAGQPNNHWCVVYGWNDKGWKCFDTYDGGRKILSYDHNIQICKRISVKKNDVKKNWLQDLWISLLDFIKSML